MTPHTPGPWRVTPIAIAVFADQMKICDIRGWGYLTGVGGLRLREDQAIAIQEANANLIAAAPELLEALARIAADGTECDCADHATDQCCNHAGVFCAHCIANAALTRAEGRP